jgi:hypothetical protein
MIYQGNVDLVLKESVQLPVNDPLMLVSAMGHTKAEAEDKFEEYKRYASPVAGLAHFAAGMGIDFAKTYGTSNSIQSITSWQTRRAGPSASFWAKSRSADIIRASSAMRPISPMSWLRGSRKAKSMVSTSRAP